MNPPRDELPDNHVRDRSIWRWVAGGVLVAILFPVIVIVIMVAGFNPNSYAPAIIAAVDKATGRKLTISGQITVQLSLTPTIIARDLRLANPPGFADPNLLTLRRVEAKVSLLPLFSHRVNVLTLLLVGPDIVLEAGPDGATDWDLSQPHRDNMPPPIATPPQGLGGYRFGLKAVTIRDGTLTVKTTGIKVPIIIALPELTGIASSLSAPLQFSAKAQLRSTRFTVSGVVGPIERFSGIGSGPWPVDLIINTAGATATIQGALDRPRTAQGYDLLAKLSIPKLETALQHLPDGQVMPAFHNLEASARIVDQNSTIPAIDNLSITLGLSDLSSLRPGLTLDQADVELASLDQPLSVIASGALNGSPVSFVVKLGAPQALLDPKLLPATMPPQGSFPVAMTGQLGEAKISVDGAIATPDKRAGVALAVNARVPDLSTLSAVAARSLPAWKNILLQTTLIDPGGLGLGQAIGLDGLALTMDNAALGGDVSLYFGRQPRLQLAVKISQLNVDRLETSISPVVSTTSGGTDAAVAGRPLPGLRLPLQMLRAASADIQLSADTLIWNDATYSALQAHAVLANGVLTLDPVTGELPGGSIEGHAIVDARQEPARESFELHAPALALSPLLTGLGLSGAAEGTVQAQVTASSSGDDLSAMGDGVSGQLGIATVDGIVDGSVLDRLFSPALQTVGLPANTIVAPGPVAIRCAALRLDAVDGIGTVRSLVMDSSRMKLQGQGDVNFANQTVNLVLHPQVRMAGTEIDLPVRISGSFERLKSGVASADVLVAAGKDAAGLSLSLAQRLLGNNGIVDEAASTAGLGAGPDICPAALSLARFGQAGPAAPPMTSATAAAAPTVGGPKNLLNTLLGK